MSDKEMASITRLGKLTDIKQNTMKDQEGIENNFTQEHFWWERIECHLNKNKDFFLLFILWNK